MENSENSFVWIINRPILGSVFVFFYWIFFMIPSDFLEKGIMIAKKIQKVWKKTWDLIVFSAACIIAGIGIVIILKSLIPIWRLFFEIFLFPAGIALWALVLWAIMDSENFKKIFKRKKKEKIEGGYA